jgi:CheY-like chemotaxis protein
VRKRAIDLRDVLSRAIETSRPVIDAHGHRLHVDIREGSFDCFGDLLRLTQLFVNILNNAAKYTPDGGDIWLKCARSGKSIEVRIRDNGRGIERDSIDRVFDLFMQLDTRGGSGLGGLGVGLALVRRIVDLHGGRVLAMSDGLGKGSEFIVRLPMLANVEPVREEPTAQDEGDFKPLRILVVDDNKDAADSLTRLMECLGHQVRGAYDGPAGIATAQEFSPQVAILDLGMPTMSGYDLARALKTTYPDIILIAATGWSHETALRKAREAGFQHHVLKPVTEATLIELLAHAAREIA